MTGRCYERFGGGSFLFPIPYTCDTNIIAEYALLYGIKCFEDDSLYYNPNNEDCEYYLTQLELGLSQAGMLNFKVNPNPFENENPLRIRTFALPLK